MRSSSWSARGDARIVAPVTCSRSSAASTPARPGTLRQTIADLYIRGRDRDRSVERSALLEPIDERIRLLFGDARKREIECDGVERSHVGAGLLSTVQDTVDTHGHRSQRDLTGGGRLRAHRDVTQVHSGRRSTPGPSLTMVTT